jgi:hypothetical protein
MSRDKDVKAGEDHNGLSLREDGSYGASGGSVEELSSKPVILKHHMTSLPSHGDPGLGLNIPKSNLTSDIQELPRSLITASPCPPPALLVQNAPLPLMLQSVPVPTCLNTSARNSMPATHMSSLRMHQKTTISS